MLLVDGEPRRVKFGGSPKTTNNLMELQGAIEGLVYVSEKGLDAGNRVVVVSDNQYCLGILSGKMSPTKNLESARQLRNLAVKVSASTRWVPGHSGDRWNEVCDRLAKKGKLENSGGQNG